MYVGRLHENAHANHTARAGAGSVRMCRSWDALLSWEREHSACYDPYNRTEGGDTEIDKYKYCPDGARPWEHNDLV